MNATTSTNNRSCTECRAGYHDNCSDGGLHATPYWCQCAKGLHGDLDFHKRGRDTNQPWYAPLAPAEARKLYDILMRGYNKMYKLELYNERRQAWDFDLSSAATEVIVVATDLIRVV